MEALRVGILTVSDRSARGQRDDLSGPVLRDELASLAGGAKVEEYTIVADEPDEIGAMLRRWADELDLDLILTSGGTGLGPRDVTPEATAAVLDYQVPGMAEAMRAASLQVTPHAMLSRALCGVRGRTLIVNLPGSPKAVRESLAVIAPALPHAVQMR